MSADSQAGQDLRTRLDKSIIPKKADESAARVRRKKMPTSDLAVRATIVLLVLKCKFLCAAMAYVV